jgi:tetratricopeptide (TPR) repeat protein
MRVWRLRLWTAALSVAALLATPMVALAAQTAPELPMIDPAEAAISALIAKGAPNAALASTGDADADAVLAALREVHARGIVAVRNHEAALQTVLANMPRPFVRSRTVNGVAQYRADSMEDCVAFAGTLPQTGASLDCKGNPFPTAALLLGSYYDEIGKPDRALAALDAGLVAAPNSPLVITERGAALISLRRLNDVLANDERGLAIANLSDHDRARLMRGRGAALTDLNRLDEAQQAYLDSLKLDPNNPVANNELAYIAQLRAGGGASPSSLRSVQPSKVN